MVYKLSHCNDMERIPHLDKEAKDILYKYISAISYQSEDKGMVNENTEGCVIYVTPGTNAEEIKPYFDYSKHIPEYVDCYEQLCAAVHVINNEWVVIIVMNIDNAPEKILQEID